MRKTNADSRDPNGIARPGRVDLTTTLYGELRNLAAARMAGEYGPQTLQATALLHEAWLCLGGENQPQWEDRTHFYAAVADAMRHILVDRARRRQCIRYGGGLQRVDLETWNWEQLDSSKTAADDEALLALHDSLEKLTLIDPETSELVKLRFFAGLSVAEAAEAMELSVRTTHRRLAYARAWLRREIRRDQAA